MEHDERHDDWREAREAILKCWPRLSNDELEHINGERRALVRALKVHYRTTFSEIERQVSDFELHDERAANMARPSLGFTDD